MDLYGHLIFIELIFLYVLLNFFYGSPVTFFDIMDICDCSDLGNDPRISRFNRVPTLRYLKDPI